jgi:hypothetical protein
MSQFKTFDVDDEQDSMEQRVERLLERLKMQRPENLKPAEFKIVLAVEHLLLLVDEAEGENPAETAIYKLEFFRSLTHYTRGVVDAFYTVGNKDLSICKYIKLLRGCATELLLSAKAISEETQVRIK